MKKYAIAFVIGLVAVLGLTPMAFPQARSVNVQILAINDYHGHLEPANLTMRLPNQSVVPAGGAEYLASHIQKLRATNPHTIVVSAGDAIGATPLISGLFHDEPAIETLSAIGLDLNGVGNHEFDQGSQELLRLQKGGCHPIDGCKVDRFSGAKFQFLAANVIDRASQKTLFPPYQIREFNGVKMAFIGMTLRATPNIVTPAGVAGLDFKDEADTVNALIPELKRQGVRAIAVLVHEGGITTGGYNDCPNISGAIVDIVKRTDPAVDLFITGHTHQAYICQIDGRSVTSAASFGRLITDIDVAIDRRSGDITRVRAENIIVSHNLSKNPRLSQLIAKYQAVAAPIANRIIGTTNQPLTRTVNAAGESLLGQAIADAQLLATRPAGAVIAFMNPGGIRADLPQGNITYSQAFGVQPFGNNLVTMTLTGQQIQALLEQQFNNPIQGRNRILQISQGFTYEYSGNKVSNLKLNGTSINPATPYRITVNSFLASGGDGFSLFRAGGDRLDGVSDLAALEAFLKSAPSLNFMNRITIN